MDEIENILYSYNPINISNLISKIIDNVRKKHLDGVKDFPEVKFLKEKLMDVDPLISEVSGKAITVLINDGILSIDVVLTDVISTMNSVKCISSLINILGDLLYMQRNDKNFTFNLHYPQHPFITTVIGNPDAADYILIKLQNLLEDFDRSSVNKVFEPFYLYCLCCPSRININLLRYRLWILLFGSNNVDKQLHSKILCWLLVQKRDNLQIIQNHLVETLRYPRLHEDLDVDIIILWQVNVLYNMAFHKLDMQPALCCLQQIFEKRKIIFIDSILLIFSQIIDVCSPIHLKNVLLTCKILIERGHACMYALDTIKASLLPWLASLPTFIDEAHQLIKDILILINKKDNLTVNAYNDLKDFVDKNENKICTDKIIFIAVNLTLNFEQFYEENLLKEWLTEMKQVPDELIRDVFNFLCGLLMSDYKDLDIPIIILELLLKCIEKEITFSSKLLTLILYKLSNNLQPQYHFALIKVLPKLVILQDNIPKVISIIQVISKQSENLFNVAISLAYDAWKIDNKCYIYLEDMLVQNIPVKKKWERYVTKAFILKELCEMKPETHGKDVVAHLSKILNDCDDENGALPCSLAIDAITLLCRNGIIDIQTTWSTLAPKFQNDKRIPIVRSLCNLIKEVSQLPNSDSYKTLFEAVTKKLWEYIEYGDPQISEVAFLSLTSFGMEHICNTLPEKYVEPGTVSTMQSILGKTWIHFIIVNSASKAVMQFIKQMVSIEIDGYLKYIYQQKGPKEPINYSYLPSYSIVRAIGEFIKTWVIKWKGSIHDKLYIECLKIYSEEFSKPLPPLDWCFLLDLIHDPETKGYAVDIASHQVVMSGTARRLIENYLLAVTENPQDEDVLLIFKNLKFLSRSIQPLILKPFFEISIWYVINNDKSESSLLDQMFNYLKSVLHEENVQETNKIIIVQVLDSILFTTDVNSKLFEHLCQVIAVAPSTCLKEVASVKVTDNSEVFLKTLKIRCALAKITKTTAPLDWLNEVIDFSCTYHRDVPIWSELAEVIKTHIKNHNESVTWFLELIGQIQAKVADRCELTIICHFFDILIFVVVYFSGFYTFLNKNENKDSQMKKLFPSSLAALLDRFDWEACSAQVLEWLYHMTTEESLSKDYRKLFGSCLQALKHNDEFAKNDRFLKYISSCMYFD